VLVTVTEPTVSEFCRPLVVIELVDVLPVAPYVFEVLEAVIVRDAWFTVRVPEM
jgi:hypothetical protein